MLQCMGSQKLDTTEQLNNNKTRTKFKKEKEKLTEPHNVNAEVEVYKGNKKCDLKENSQKLK